MAHQPLAVVQRQGDITVRAFHSLAAASAGDKAGIAAPVNKQHDLLFFFQPVPDQLLEPLTEYGFISVFHFFSQVHDLHCRHLTSFARFASVNSR